MSCDRPPKAIRRVPGFAIEDFRPRFALRLQREYRADPDSRAQIAAVTYTATNTVKEWSHGQHAGFEAVLRTLEYLGPDAVNEVLLEPMGMTGARWIEDKPLIGHLDAARRELEAAVTAMAEHPDSGELHDATEVIGQLMALLGELTARINEHHRARACGNVVTIQAQERRA